MRGRIALALVLTVAVSAAGCVGGSSSSNGEAGKSGAQVYSDAKRAVTGASSVHIFGSFTDAGKTVRVDLVLGAVAAKGFMAQGTARADIARVGSTAYMRASTDFWRRFAGAAAAQVLHDKWLKGSTRKQPFVAFAQFMSIDALITEAFKGHGTLTNLGERTYKGEKVVAIKDAKDGSIVYVAATGKPYLVATSGGGSITFADWNKQVSITAPNGAVDISSLSG